VPVEVVFLTDHGPHPMRALLDRAGTAHRTLTGGVRGLVLALRRRRPSLVHTHGYKAGVLGRLAGAVLGIPVVSTYHAGEPGAGRLRLYHGIDRATAFLAHTIAVSEPILAKLPRRTRVIQNFVALPPQAARPGPRARTVAFVGRLSHEKGPDEFCALAEAFPAARFEAYGDGPMRESLAARFAGRVRFRGAVPSMSDHWREIGLLCMPSRHEGLPLAALEAMANGVPVAAYAVGGLPRCIEHGRSGWLAAPGRRAELVAAVGAWQAQDDDAASAMAEAARATIARDFSREAGVDKVLAVYAQALGRPCLHPG
jgi:glycosyltransferase involved in cell wall biosynthesis